MSKPKARKPIAKTVTHQLPKYDEDPPHALYFDDVLASVHGGTAEALGRIHFTEGARGKAIVKDLDPKQMRRLLEGRDPFGTANESIGGVGAGSSDFAPVVGGPYYKQLYSNDFIKQANLAFFASNHDPLGRGYLNILRDFTLGRGYRVDSKNTLALSVFAAYAEANKLQHQMNQFAWELATYGESMWYKLPKNQAMIRFKPLDGEKVPRALIPRVRLFDPTSAYEIVTVPEDILDVQFYVIISPTQWQSYGALDPERKQLSAKYIFQTIPSEQMFHYRVNTVSNEKRGRSDLFAALGYMKRLRDAVDYSILGLLKQCAWSIDVEIDGSQEDIDAYSAAIAQMGPVSNPASEFVHSKYVKRQLLSPQGARGGHGSAFEWTLSMVSAALGVPVSYWGMHLSGGQTRASALVSTEPFAKKCEMRQDVYRQCVQDHWDYCMESFGLQADCEITWPEIVVQDRSQKLKDIDFAVRGAYISHRQAGPMVAKELDIDNYDFDKTTEEIEQEHAEFAPLTMPPSAPTPVAGDTETGLPSTQDKQDQAAQGMNRQASQDEESTDDLGSEHH